MPIVLWVLSLSTSRTDRPPPPFNMFHTCRLLTPPRSFSGPAWTHKVRFSCASFCISVRIDDRPIVFCPRNNCREVLVST
ncbi:hypothetical protein C8R41DRAFT_421130 [Lentinula lateritia]|uniref:Secreted protein n=1 Tax=Lentinula lateritia TaxID=40482 RepID=A0ABQ8VC24_9AGAR|nr:hypothetical protein C8R41DRAFT_421130 [Lentinula lateritia]